MPVREGMPKIVKLAKKAAIVIRLIGDCIGIVCGVLAVVSLVGGSGFGDRFTMAGIYLLLCALFVGGGRAISWILQGFAKSD